MDKKLLKMHSYDALKANTSASQDTFISPSANHLKYMVPHEHPAPNNYVVNQHLPMTNNFISPSASTFGDNLISKSDSDNAESSPSQESMDDDGGQPFR